MQQSLRHLAKFLALLFIVTFCACPLAQADETPAALKSYLVLGSDYYSPNASSSARTDVMILVTLDPVGKRLVFTSILRDSKVKTPGGGENKLNSVFARYGFDGIKATIKRHLDVQPDGVITIDFAAVKDLVDAFGGVDIEISGAEYAMIRSILLHKDPNMPKGPGMVHMTGRIALAYMRDRSSGSSGDFSRTEHQRKVIAQVMQKASKLSLPQLLEVYKALQGKIHTDMNYMQLLSALQSAYGLIDAKVVEYHIPAPHTFSYGRLRGSSVLDIRWKDNAEMLHEVLYPGEQPTPQPTSAPEPTPTPKP